MARKKTFEPRAAKKGHVLLLAPESITAIAVDSIEYEIESDGSVEVPEKFALELEGHGLVRAPLPAPKV